jgi:hypothetical protein
MRGGLEGRSGASEIFQLDRSRLENSHLMEKGDLP